MRLLRDEDGREPEQEMAVARAALGRAAAGEAGPLLRVYRPAPTVAFGRLDALRPGYEAAAAAARRHGFRPVLRVAGGHAAAYHGGCVGLDVIVPEPDPIPALHARFERAAATLAGALGSLGVDARVGELPGEYCPGAWSVNARGRVKLAGTAQRVVRGAWLLAVIVVAEHGPALAPVLEEVYAELGLPLDPATIGGTLEESPDATLDAVEGAAVAALLGMH